MVLGGGVWGSITHRLLPIEFKCLHIAAYAFLHQFVTLYYNKDLNRIVFAANFTVPDLLHFRFSAIA